MNETRNSGKWPKPTFSEWGPGQFEKQVEASWQARASADSRDTTSAQQDLVGLGTSILFTCVCIVGAVGLAMWLPTDKDGNILVPPVGAQIRRVLGGTWSWLERWWCKSAMRRLLVLEGIAIAVAVMLSASGGVFEYFAEDHPLAYMLIVITLPTGWVLRKPISRWLEEVTR